MSFPHSPQLFRTEQLLISIVWPRKSWYFRGETTIAHCEAPIPKRRTRGESSGHVTVSRARFQLSLCTASLTLLSVDHCTLLLGRSNKTYSSTGLPPVHRARSSHIRRPRVEISDRKETAHQDRSMFDSSSSKASGFDSTISSNLFLSCVLAPTSVMPLIEGQFIIPPAYDLSTLGTDVAFTPQNSSNLGNLDLARYDFTFDHSRYMSNFDVHSNGF